MSELPRIMITDGEKKSPAWATEKTLIELRDRFPKGLMDAEERSRKSSDELSQEVKENTQALKNLTAQEKEAKEKQDQAEKNAKEAVEKQKDLNNKFGQLGADFTKTVLTQGFSDPAKSIGAWRGAFDSAAARADAWGDEFAHLVGPLRSAAQSLMLLDKGLQTVFSVNKPFLELYDTGMRFQDGMQGMVRASIDTGLGMENFTKILKQGGQATAMLGNGAPRLLKTFMEITGQGGALVMSQDQAAESFLQSAEIFQNSGVRRGMLDEDLAKKSKGLISEINELSKATGQSRTDILKFVNETFKKPETIGLMATLPKQMRDGFTKFTESASILGKDAGNQMTDMMQKVLLGKGSLGLLDEKALGLLSAFPELQQGVMSLQKDIANGGQGINEDMVALSDNLAKLEDIDPERLNRLFSVNPEMQTFIGNIIASNRIFHKKADEEQKQIKLLMDRGKTEEAAKKQIQDERDAAAKLQADINDSYAGFNRSKDAILLPLLQIGEGLMKILAPFARALSYVVTTLSDWDGYLDGSISKLAGWGAELLLGLGTIKLLFTSFRGIIGLLGRFLKSPLGWLTGVSGGKLVEMVGGFFKGGGGTAAKAGEKVLEKGIAEVGLKEGSKFLGKSLLKKIPGVGALAGLGFAAQRAMKGDWKGAGLEAASGLVSLAPGLGTAASVAIDAGLAARDAGLFGGNTPGSDARAQNDNPMGGRTADHENTTWQDNVYSVFQEMNATLRSIDEKMRKLVGGSVVGDQLNTNLI